MVVSSEPEVAILLQPQPMNVVYVGKDGVAVQVPKEEEYMGPKTVVSKSDGTALRVSLIH